MDKYKIYAYIVREMFEDDIIMTNEYETIMSRLFPGMVYDEKTGDNSV